MATATQILAITLLLAAVGCDRQPPPDAPPSTPPSSQTSDVPPAWPPPDLAQATILKDNALMLPEANWKDPDTPIGEIRDALLTFHSIPRRKWETQYSHVAGMDQMGWTIFPDGSRAKWLLRPGGLAIVEPPAGGPIYLAKPAQTTPSTAPSPLR